MSRIEDALRKAEELERQKRGDGDGSLSMTEPEAPEPDSSPAETPASQEPLVLKRDKPASVPAPANVPAKAPAKAPARPTRASRRSAKAKERFDKIRANILLALPEQDTRTLAVCSSLPREGATTTVSHLALSMAEQGSTLLVDANLLHPQLHEYFKITDRKGLADFLEGDATLDDVTCRTSHPHLHVVTMGEKRRETPAHISSGPMRAFLAEAQSMFETVIIDCAPLQSSAEAALCAAMTDGVVLVVRAGRTRREVVQHSTEMIHNSSARCVGVILNQMRYPIPSLVYDRL